MKSFDYMAYCVGARSIGFLGIGLIVGALIGATTVTTAIFAVIAFGLLLLGIAGRAKDVEDEIARIGTLSEADFFELLDKAPHDYARAKLVAYRDHAPVRR